MPNALAQEKSPYLRQHADNPVAWLPWGEAAFARARAEQKPIFLSIGYSTCHWCHVMAHESFEDPATAAILNEHFIAIKVDREERPDVDKVYMTYVQAMTGHGGWPLSAWLTPGLQPFYGGTYFPPVDRHGRAGFPTILLTIARGWREERDKLIAEGERAVATLREHYVGRRGQGAGGREETLLAVTGGDAFEKGLGYFLENFDAEHGGFGGAPKFPRASNLDFLFRCAAVQGVASEIGAEAVRLATATLRGMARGGIHDHVGGGYHRYSVDAEWFVPHFEKMLYDQAQIALNALEARQATGDERYAWMARDIFDYVLRDLTSPAGGFYTAEDADSVVPPDRARNEEQGASASEAKHAEGAFYVWTAAELREVLGDDAALVAAHFGVQEAGNVEAARDPHAEFTGKNILAQARPLAATAAQLGLTPEQANDRLLASLAKLREVRGRRPRPLLDDKIITANNGLMISALAKAHQVLGMPAGGANPPDEPPSARRAPTGTPATTPVPAAPYLQAATRAAEFLQRELYDAARGVLYRSWREGRGAAEGFAEDYAFLIQGLLDLYEASFEPRWLRWAGELQAAMDARFWDDTPVRPDQGVASQPMTGDVGGYFNSRAGDASIVLRLKEDYDGAEPAPSSVAAMNLLRLATVRHDDPLRDRGLKTIEAFRTQWSGAPQAMPAMLCAVALALEPPRQVVLAGDPADADFRALAAVLAERLGPRRAVLALTGGPEQAGLVARAPWLADMRPVAGKATAYVCEKFVCQAPVTEPEALRRLLAG